MSNNKTYRIFMKDSKSELKFIIFTEANGFFEAEKKAIEEFEWASIISIRIK